MIADSRPAPYPGSENHIELPIAITMKGTVQSVDESTVTPLAEEPKVTQPEVETNIKEIPTPSEPEVAQPVDETKVIEPQVTQPVRSLKWIKRLMSHRKSLCLSRLEKIFRVHLQSTLQVRHFRFV